jgi:peptidoglycan/LPS O-acetylase OafA/YrhL
MTRLSDVVHGRNNNFHLLRLVAALAVLGSHAFPLATGDRSIEPLRAELGCTPGSIAVDLFFLVSGLLVTISLVRRASVVDFARARFFRIWPALAVALLLTVLVLGPFFTTWPVGAYFADRQTWRYLGKDLLLLHGIEYLLPGVFAGNPWPGAVNGSLWTLPGEVRCYIALLAAWIAARWLDRRRTGLAFRAIVAVAWALLLAWHLASLRHVPLEDSQARLPWMFSTGAAAYLLRDHIRLSWKAFGAAAIALATATLNPTAFAIVYTAVLPYLMLCLAYLPGGAVLRFNRLGDYSYGTYIYAYPVQQSLLALRPGMGPLELLALSLVATLALAVVSWHVVESPALGLVRRRPARATAPAVLTPGA